MSEPVIVNIAERSELLSAAARWFHEKWGIPESAYRESMEAGLSGAAVPRWYVALDGERIVGGLGVIENDFHPRLDLAPNVCAVYVEKDCRNRGLAGRLLDRVAADMAAAGVPTLYLHTDHDSFYERYGWEYLCPVTGDGETEPSRMYVHKS